MVLLSAALVALAPTTASQAAPGDITLTGTISSISGAESRTIQVRGPGGFLPTQEDDDTFSATGPPGQYSVYVSETGGPQGDWSFSGETARTVYTQNSTIQITVPLHTLALDVKYANGSPAPANVDLSCWDAAPAGWQYADTDADRHVNGVSSFLVANHAAGDDDCDLRVESDAGPIRTFLVPGNASTYTAVLNAGVHVQGPSPTGWATPRRRVSRSRRTTRTAVVEQLDGDRCRRPLRPVRRAGLLYVRRLLGYGPRRRRSNTIT